jgi:hypothetical protein
MTYQSQTQPGYSSANRLSFSLNTLSLGIQMKSAILFAIVAIASLTTATPIPSSMFHLLKTHGTCTGCLNEDAFKNDVSALVSSYEDYAEIGEDDEEEADWNDWDGEIDGDEYDEEDEDYYY